MTKKQEIGRFGEDKICEYLINLHYRVLERNHREKFGEIDIMAIEPDQTLVFIEAKAISLNEWAALNPEDNFTTHKSIKVKRMCEFFARKYPEMINEERGWRVDLIVIEISLNGKFAIRHYKNV